jgi:hypothetical protein
LKPHVGYNADVLQADGFEQLITALYFKGDIFLTRYVPIRGSADAQ